MKFEDLQRVNASISTTNIKGKEYAEVNQRIKAFRMIYPEGSISTEIVSVENGVVIMKATVSNEGKLLGTGTAYEKESSSFINKTSYIENCETSAVGRALAMCGIGIDVSVASAEEVENAINNQGKKTTPKKTDKTDNIDDVNIKINVIRFIKTNYNDGQQANCCKHYKVKDLTELTLDNCKDFQSRYMKGEKGE